MSRPCRIGGTVEQIADQLGDALEELDGEDVRVGPEAARFGILQFIAGLQFALDHGDDWKALNDGIAGELVVLREQGHDAVADRVEAALRRRGWVL